MFSFEQLKEHRPTLEFSPVDVNGTSGAIFPKEYLVEAAKLLRDHFGFDQLIDAFGIDRNERKGRFEITYNLRNHKTHDRAFLKVRCEEKHPHVPSLTSVWDGANWHEREAYDMYGVKFDGHPDLRRMYLPEEFEHHPLRKDFPLMGIPGSLPLPKREGALERFQLPDRGE